MGNMETEGMKRWGKAMNRLLLSFEVQTQYILR